MSAQIPTRDFITYLASLPNRCEHGFHASQSQFHDCATGAPDEWSIFRAALRKAVRDDGSIHQCDVRPIIRGRIAPKHIGQLWRRARSEGLVRDTRLREQSNDIAGRIADKLDRVYAWQVAA